MTDINADAFVTRHVDITVLRGKANSLERDLVYDMLVAGCTWLQVGSVLGCTRQASQQRWGWIITNGYVPE
jgi:hypothetical protein